MLARAGTPAAAMGMMERSTVCWGLMRSVGLAVPRGLLWVSSRHVRRTVSSRLPNNRLTQEVVEDRLHRSERLDVPETTRAQALVSELGRPCVPCLC